VDQRLKRELITGIVEKMPKDRRRSRLGLYVVIVAGLLLLAALLGHL